MRAPRLTLPQFCSVTEAADILGVNRATVNRWIKAGTLNAGTLGRMLLIPREEIERLARQNGGRAAEALLPALTLRPSPDGEVRATFTTDPNDPRTFFVRWEYDDLVMTAKALLDRDPREWGRLIEERRQSRQQAEGAAKTAPNLSKEEAEEHL